jgi:hypothetical protein
MEDRLVIGAGVTLIATFRAMTEYVNMSAFCSLLRRLSILSLIVGNQKDSLVLTEKKLEWTIAFIYESINDTCARR